MNRLTLCLLIALLVSVATGLTVILFQHRTLSALREENEALARAAAMQTSVSVTNIPGRYRWIKKGVDSGIITLNADHSMVGATGKTNWGGQLYRWFYQGGELALLWGDTHLRFTESTGPGNFSGRDGNMQLIKVPERSGARWKRSAPPYPACYKRPLKIGSTSNHLKDRIALVTGGAAGIGRALCEQLAANGAFVVVTDINAAGAEEVAAGIRQCGGRAEAMTLDVSSEAEVQQAISAVAASHGRLDYLFNNAAVAAVGEFRDGNVTDFRRVLDVNLFGVVHGTMAAYRVMLKQGFGHIVNISSVTGLMPTPIIAAYSTSKWAIIGFSTAVRAEAAGLGVKVSVACPGLVRTDMGEHNVYWNVRKEDHLAQLPLRWAIGPDQAAMGILRGVARNQAINVFPFSVRVALWVYRICPWIFAPLLGIVVKRFRALRIKR